MSDNKSNNRSGDCASKAEKSGNVVQRSTLDGTGGIGSLLAVDVQTADSDTFESGGFWFCYDGNAMELVAGATGYGGAMASKWHADRLVGGYEYAPYGNVANTPSAFALTNPMRFSTKYWNDEAGLGDWGERYPSPTAVTKMVTGRDFLSISQLFPPPQTR